MKHFRMMAAAVLLLFSLLSCERTGEEGAVSGTPAFSSSSAEISVSVTFATQTDVIGSSAAEAFDAEGDPSGTSVGISSDSSSAQGEIPSFGDAQAASSSISVSNSGANEEDRETIREKIRNADRKADELGGLLIILYHHVGGEDSLYYRSVASLKNDLKNLYDRGYRLISMEDYIHSNFDIPAGTTPAILTFDDGVISHFKVAWNEEGERIPDPDCAVGVIDAFSREYPDFGRGAVFYINSGAFGEPEHLEWKLRYLHENGYEIGNHTHSHTALDTLDKEGLQEEIGKNAARYRDVYSEMEMTSIAYPYGNRPVAELADMALHGRYDGREYRYPVGLIAGWCPAKPLYAKSMHPSEVYRVQGGTGSQQLDWWLAYLDEHEDERYFSDGYAGILTVPERKFQELRDVDIEVLILPE